MPEEKALGVLWKPEDIIGFKISIVEKPLTSRGLLAMLSSIYDPLGLVSPFLLKGRKIIQELCKGNFQWDDDIPEDIKIKWLKWKRQLASLEDIKHKPENFGDVTNQKTLGRLLITVCIISQMLQKLGMDRPVI